MDKEVEENYSESLETSVEMVDYMLSNHPPPQHQISLDKLSFADVMQFADFGPKLALNQSKAPNEDDNYFFRFHLMNDKLQEDGPSMGSLPPPPPPPQPQILEEDGEDEGVGKFPEHASSVQQLGFGGGGEKIGVVEVKNKRKRPRSMKTTEEVESQRMTHIAVERNRRRQMNEHLRVLRSLMPGSYVQRGDQASIIGGAIEFVRELEQLLQCLESQKRRRLFDNAANEPPRNINMTDINAPPLPFLPPLPPCNNSDMNMTILEDTAENKSCIGDVEVRVLGYDAMIKILSKRRIGQLIKIIEALEELQFDILHTNVTTIEQTVLYSFNVKATGETGCTAEEIANSVQQILSFIDSSTI